MNNQLTPKMKETVERFRNDVVYPHNQTVDDPAKIDFITIKAQNKIEQFLIEAMQESKKEVIRDLRRWMKGKEVTKDKVRQWCNGVMEDL